MNKLLCGRRILVIEDETMISMMIERMLADLGCESVTAAATVNKALSLIDGQVFDCAMLDMNMNSNTGGSRNSNRNSNRNNNRNSNNSNRP